MMESNGMGTMEGLSKRKCSDGKSAKRPTKIRRVSVEAPLRFDNQDLQEPMAVLPSTDIAASKGYGPSATMENTFRRRVSVENLPAAKTAVVCQESNGILRPIVSEQILPVMEDRTEGESVSSSDSSLTEQHDKHMLRQRREPIAAAMTLAIPRADTECIAITNVLPSESVFATKIDSENRGGPQLQAKRSTALRRPFPKEWVYGCSLLVLLVSSLYFSGPSIAIPNSIYVSGGGFSGFWFILGQLQGLVHTLEQRQSNSTALATSFIPHQFVCYSAGCLASVAVMQGWNVTKLADLAFDVQKVWSSGALPRTQVVDRFVGGLLASPEESAWFLKSGQLSVLTTSPGKWGLRTTVTIPRTPADLHRALVQTAWIPGATGNDVWFQHATTMESKATPANQQHWHLHMDGVFDAMNHPQCTYSIGMPPFSLSALLWGLFGWSRGEDVSRARVVWELFFNILNPNLSHEMVERFEAMGEIYGAEALLGFR